MNHRESAERELQAALQTSHEHAGSDMSSETQDALDTWQLITVESCQLRQDLREQVCLGVC
jgi:hypothetical protein